MRLVTFQVDSPLGAVERVGCMSHVGVIDVNLAYRDLLTAVHGIPRAREVADAVVPADMLALIETWPVARPAIEDAIERVVAEPASRAAAPARLVWEPEDVRLLAPLPKPRTLREFGQFVGHATQGGRRRLSEVWYEAPHYWKGNPNTIVAPGSVIAWPDGVERLDFELEIACVVGRAGVDLDEAEALDHVHGFTLFNDICARDLQARELPAGKGPSKSHDFCSVMGPALVTPEELDLDRLVGRVSVNGEEWARAATDDMHFGWATVVAHASRYDGIVPGDVLVSGTLTGCSAIEHHGWADSGPLLRPGDVVELEIEGLGVLQNTIGEPRQRAVATGFGSEGIHGGGNDQ